MPTDLERIEAGILEIEVMITPIHDELLRQMRAAQSMVKIKQILAEHGGKESNIGYPNSYWSWLDAYRYYTSPL